MTKDFLVAPHGGALVNRMASSTEANALRDNAAGLPKITLSAKQACDLEMIAIGAFSPLTGFIGKTDFQNICKHMRLTDSPSGAGGGRTCSAETVWPIPITLAVPDEVKEKLKVGRSAALHHADGTLLALIRIKEIYPHDKKLEIPSVFATDDEAHPGVKDVLIEGPWCIAGPIEVITVVPQCEADEQFPEFRLPPAETRAAFEAKGWRTITAFQTRNPIHRAHEYLTKCALEITDGLLIHPLVGQTQPGDIPADVRMACYQVLIEEYYVGDRTMLTVMPAAMRYAGPREAVLHALVRQNYGCSHFIVGRDHAGVGDYYGTYDAQKIFDEFNDGQIGIRPLKFEHASWCNACEGMTSSKTCPHGPEEKIFLSGTKVRAMLRKGQNPPLEFTRPEVAKLLIQWAQSQ